MHTITTSPDHTKACIPLLSLIDWDQSQHIHWIIFSDHLGQPSWAFVNLRFGIYSSLNDPNIQCILILNVRWLLANSVGTLSGHRIPPGFPLPQNSPIFCDKTHWIGCFFLPGALFHISRILHSVTQKVKLFQVRPKTVTLIFTKFSVLGITEDQCWRPGLLKEVKQKSGSPV